MALPLGRQLARFCAAALITTAQHVAAEEASSTTTAPEPQTYDMKLQATWVRQIKPGFGAAYSGPNSLSAARETSYSFTATVAMGWRVWSGGEFYFNPEAAQGVPLSGLTGLGGFSNGEMARTAGPDLRIYHARIFLRQSFDLGGTRESVPSAMNQLAGDVDRRRVVVSVGNLSVLDLFDGNAYSHDPRTQFLNWSLMTHGAYDYAADARGYSWGAAVEWFHDDWALRAGRFAQPKRPNEMELDPHLVRHYGDQVELEHGHELSGQPGRVRLLAFRNKTRMARFREAIDLAAVTGGVPDIDAVRNSEALRYGGGVNLEQQIRPDLGAFFRASWSNGRTETYAFTEIDRSISGGLSWSGRAWQRPDDTLGLGVVRNTLSSDRRRYLEAGGISFFIGDGAIRYAPETLVEAWYSLGLASHFRVSLDVQRIWNPAYNAARGPVSVGSLRLHMEF